MDSLSSLSPLLRISARILSYWKNCAEFLSAGPSQEELNLYRNRDAVVTKLSEIRRLKSRSFLPKTIGETARLTPKEIESLLFKLVLQDTKREMEVIHPNFDLFYYRKMIKNNAAYQEALEYFIDIVEHFRVLRRQYTLAHGLGSDKAHAHKLAAFDQLELVDAIATMKTVSKELRQWA